MMGGTLKYVFACLAFILIGAITYAQSCSVCTIDLTCDSVPAQPKLCPAVLPTDTAQQYYEADVTFYMPAQFNITDPVSGTVDLTQIDVVGLSGLPVGMSWTAYDYTGAVATTFYPPSNTPASERGCAKICGTPLMPGEYVITVSVLAYVSLGSTSVTQAESFDVPLTIVANPSGNSVFTMSANQGCDSVSTNFSPILQSGGDPLFTYTWDFGDSTTSTSEFPTHNYTTPGTYVVSCQIDVLQYVLSDVTVNTTNEDWCGDLDEPFFILCLGSPDVFFRINDNSSLYDSPTIDNTTTPSWSNLGVVLNSDQFTIQFFDADGFTNPDDDLGLTIMNITGPATYNVSTISPFSNTPAISGNLTIITQLDTSYIDYDTIHVYGVPSADTITYALNDSVCTGDSVMLTTGGGTFYQWYNDTNLIVGATDSVYYANQNGSYLATVTSSVGCESSTGIQDVTIVPYPVVPMFFQNVNVLTSFSTEPNLQWYMDTMPVTGETGTTLTITQDGIYFLVASNALGCTSSSDTLFFAYTPPIVNPVIAPDVLTATTPEDVSITICLYVTDADGDSLDVTGVASGPSDGTISGLSTGDTCFIYTPDVGFVGVDVVEIIVCDASGGCDTAEVTITVTAVFVNSDPVAWPTIVVRTTVGVTPITICLNATDVDNDTLDVTGVDGPSNGTVTGLSDGDTCFTYIANAGFVGSDTVYVSICDGNGGCDTVLVVINVTEVTGVGEYADVIANSISIYPNPNSGSFNVKFQTIESQDVEILIRDLVGRLVFIKQYGSINGAFVSSLELGSVGSGIYTVNINVGVHSFHRKVLVK